MSDSDAQVVFQVSRHPAKGGETVVVSIRGDVDLVESPEVRRRLLELANGKPARLVVDLAGVGYMDSSGVASLVEALQRVRSYQGTLVLAAPTPRVRSIFEIARLDTIFQIVATREEALGA